MNSAFSTGIPRFIGPKRMTWKVAWSPGSNHSLSEDFIPKVLMAVPVFLLMFPLSVPIFVLTGVVQWGLVDGCLHLVMPPSTGRHGNSCR